MSTIEDPRQAAPAEPEVVAAEAATTEPAEPATVDRSDLDFDAFYQAQATQVLAVVTALTGNRAVAEELTQEAFATAHRKWSRIAGYDQPGAWVRRVAINRAVSSLRTRQAESRALERVRHLPEPPPTADQRLDDELWEAIRALPAKQAQAIALTYVEDLPPDRVAEILGCREGTVKSHLNRARRTLADRLAPLAPTAPRPDSLEGGDRR